MDMDGLPASVWIDAQLRRAQAEGKNYYIVNKGAYAAGTVLVKINRLGAGFRVLQQQRDVNGRLGWMTHFDAVDRGVEQDIDAFIARAIDRDPDLWVVEIEDRAGENPFEGQVF